MSELDQIINKETSPALAKALDEQQAASHPPPAPLGQTLDQPAPPQELDQVIDRAKAEAAAAGTLALVAQVPDGVAPNPDLVPHDQLNCYRVLYVTVSVPDKNNGLVAHPQRFTKERAQHVVALNELAAADVVINLLHPDADEVQIQQVAAIAKNVLVAGNLISPNKTVPAETLTWDKGVPKRVAQ
jgi:hypothetical protein